MDDQGTESDAMYTISVQAHYDAAHHLRDYEGDCAKLHGHRYTVQVALQAPSLQKGEMVFDFKELKAHLRELANSLDHSYLNEIPPFDEIESTAENQARYFFDELRKRLPEELAHGLLYSRVSESPGQWAQYGVGPGFPNPVGEA